MNSNEVLLWFIHTSEYTYVNRRYVELYGFLYDKETEGEIWEWETGPVSHTLREELHELVSEGLLERTEKLTFGGEERVGFRVTSAGVSRVRGDAEGTGVHEVIMAEWGGLPLSNLLSRIREKYPEHSCY